MLLIVLAVHGCHDRLLFANVCVFVRCVTETGREEFITTSIYLLIARLVRFFFAIRSRSHACNYGGPGTMPPFIASH